jgi:hypothetical protein
MSRIFEIRTSRQVLAMILWDPQPPRIKKLRYWVKNLARGRIVVLRKGDSSIEVSSLTGECHSERGGRPRRDDLVREADISLQARLILIQSGGDDRA